LYAPAFYTFADGYHLSTNALPAISNETVISLGFGKNAGSTYQIEASGADLPEMNAFMLDKKTNTRQNLSLEPVYGFTAAEGDAEDRFVLYFGNVGLDEPDGNTGNLWFSDNTLYISAPTQAGQTALVEVFGVTGQRIFTKSVVLNKLTTLTVDYHGFVAVKVTTDGETLTGSGILKGH
jgi:hypothetical protein